MKNNILEIMAKKCVICDEKEAKYNIKGTSDFYCKECAVESFGDISLLVKVEDMARRIKQLVDDKSSEKDDDITDEHINVTINK